MKKLIHPIAYAVVAVAAYKFGSLPSTSISTSSETEEEVSIQQSQQELVSPAADALSQDEPTPNRTNLSEIFGTDDYHARYADLKEYFKGITNENVDQYLVEIRDLPPGPKANGIMRQFFSSWGEIDGLAAFEYAKNQSGRDRLGYLSAAAAGWAETQPIEAWGAIMDASNHGSMFGISSYNVLNAISRNDLKLAVDLSLEIKDDHRRASHYSSLVRDVSFHGNYDELYEIANTLENPNDKSALVKSIFETWGKYETDAPNQLMATISDPEVSSYAMQGMMSGWADVDGAGAFSYALENRDQPGMEEALESIAKTWSRSVTAHEMESMMAQVSAAEDSSKLMQSMIYSVAQANPKLAMDWASNTSDERAKSSAVRSTMSEWSRSNINEAEQYYHSMTDEKLRANSAYSIARGLSSRAGNSERILSLLDGFEDLTAKGGALVTIAMAVSQSKIKDKELQTALRTMIETDPNIKEKLKSSILKQL